MLDMIREGATQIVEVKGPDDQVHLETRMDPDVVWWKGHAVNSTKFGRMAYELNELDRMADEAYNRMPTERADVLAKQIRGMSRSHRRAIDAKSSESRRDSNNAQATLLDRVGRNKVEHVYTAKDAASRSMAEMFMGGRKQDDFERS